MTAPTRYEAMRAIHDQATRENPGPGTAITLVSPSADAKTIPPVEAALGHPVAQHLLLGAGPLLPARAGRTPRRRQESWL